MDKLSEVTRRRSTGRFGTIVGAVGASAGTVEQDIAVAEAAITALGHQT